MTPTPTQRAPVGNRPNEAARVRDKRRIRMAEPPHGGPVRCLMSLARHVRRAVIQGGPAQAA